MDLLAFFFFFWTVCVPSNVQAARCLLPVMLSHWPSGSEDAVLGPPKDAQGLPGHLEVFRKPWCQELNSDWARLLLYHLHVLLKNLF